MTVGDADGKPTRRTRPARRPRSSASSPAAASSAVVTVGACRARIATGLREPYGAPDALEQRDAEPLLEALELLADGGLAVAEGRGGAA